MTAIFLITIFWIMTPCSLCAAQAQVLTYKDAVIDALKYSPNLQMRIEDILISNAQYRSSVAGLYPSVNVSGRAERYENLDTRNSAGIQTIGNEVVGGNMSSWRSSVNLTGQYYFSHWYKKRYETQYYEQLKASSVHQCEAEAKKIIREVTDIYGLAVETKIRLDYSSRIARLLRDILNIKQEAYTLGQYPFEDVLKAESEAVSMEKDIARSQKDLTDLLHRLSGYTGGRYFESASLDPIIFKGEMASIDETKVIAAAPEYQMKQKEMEALRAKTIAARNSLLPDIAVYGRYDLFNSSPDGLDASLKDTRPSSYSAGILISIPLFDGGAKYWEWKKNLYEIRKQEENIRAVKEDRHKDIRTIYDGHRNLMKSYRHYKKLGGQYAKMLSISKKAQSLGERSRLDILELEKDALAVERDLKVTEHTLAVYEKQMALEIDYNHFLKEYDGDWACRY